MSDVYVRLGYEFNIACRAFNAIGVDTQDLGPVPDLLRTILEDTLSQEASQASLDRFLPRIRDIIINLLQGLKKKQSRLRAKTAKDMERSGSSASRQDAIDSIAADGQEIPARSTSGRAARQGSRDLPTELPPRTSSRNDGRSSPAYDNSGQRLDRYDSRATMQSSSSSMSSNTAQNMPVLPPYPQEDTIPTQAPAPAPPPHANGQSFPPPPPPPKQQDALLALQRGGDLERRASRRFSTYQIKQQLGGAANGIPMIPSQNSPIPNRGREVRESIQAVRQRGSQMYNRQKSERRLVGDDSPNRNLPPRISEENIGRAPADPQLQDETTVKTPEDKLAPSYPLPEISEPAVSATISGPVEEPFISKPPPVPTSIPARRPSRKEAVAPPEQFVPEDSPQPGKPLTLFLQYKSKVKKFILDDASDLSIARIQLAFIDKFAWNTHGDGVDLPEIYLQDSVSGVRYELEDLSDIKNNSVLVLNVEALDEVKRHIDDGLGQLRRVVEGIKTAVEDQQSALQKVNDRQQETAKEIAGIAAAPRLSTLTSPPTSSATRSLSPIKATPEQLSEIQSIRRNLAVMRQTYSSFVSEIEGSMAAIRTKAASVKSVAVKVALPDLKGESGRAYVNQGVESLSKDQENLVEKVEEVQDSVEDLRKDVVTRGVRPLPRQLEQVAKDIADATTEVKRMETNLAREKPLFSKIWKAELQQVCDDRDNIAEAEALIQDFKVDLESAEKTFRLVEEATKQQYLAAAQSPPGSANPIAPRSLSGGKMVGGEIVDPGKAKNQVLVEVAGLKIDHDDRMSAIERAEKARQKELESRKEGAFKKELGSFVEEGKLKKTGGVEEAERLRKVRDERARREVWERQNAQGNNENTPPGTDGDVDKPDGLAIPRAEKAEGNSSPEPEFVEAKEEQPN